MDTKERLSRITVILHWIVGLTIMGLLGVGLYMTKNEVWSLYEPHKSIGVLIFPIIVLRAAWRLKLGWPPALDVAQQWQHTVAKLVHWGLLLGSLLMPMSGMLFSGASGHGFGIFSWTMLAENPMKDKAGEVVAYSEFWANFGETVHGICGYFMIALLVLHVVGALKHHVIDKDRILKRMLGQ